METTTKVRRRTARSQRPDLDPYLVTATTWTREELLRAREGHDGLFIVEPHHPAAKAA